MSAFQGFLKLRLDSFLCSEHLQHQRDLQQCEVEPHIVPALTYLLAECFVETWYECKLVSIMYSIVFYISHVGIIFIYLFIGST